MGDDFKSRLDAVRARIERAARRAGRDPGSVTLVAVSKSVSVERLREAITNGCRVFGENRVQEALAKMEEVGARAPAGSEAPAVPGRARGIAEDGASWHSGGGRVQTGASEPISLSGQAPAGSEAPAAPGRVRGSGASEPISLGARAPAEIEWHLIGPLQTNKIKAAVGRFALLHAVDRLEVAERLDRAARERGLTQAVLLEVNVAGEKTKHGFSPDEVVRVAERMGALQGIRVLGLMAVPPAAGAPEEARPYFRRLRILAAEVQAQKIPLVVMQELSMGMSGDFEVAVEEGATLVRIGTALFGERGQI
ncbi:MAG: YggS family pyridoxal phosphate-dependent enzyme [Nitrospirae bacterium]|nr:MAG: YggS family pyridoxal phosphate-dependent enzyme [Nitrospirota bacterium]